jgi:hypothetical protein
MPKRIAVPCVRPYDEHQEGLRLTQDKKVKLKHWCGVWSIFGLKGAPVLEFHAAV